jgi:exodeoxyribonuclease VII small subunit
MPKITKSPPPTSFEAALEELERIVQSMESSPLALEASLSAYERGIDLLKYCQDVLAEADRKIQILDTDGLHDFNPEDGERLRKPAL